MSDHAAPAPIRITLEDDERVRRLLFIIRQTDHLQPYRMTIDQLRQRQAAKTELRQIMRGLGLLQPYRPPAPRGPEAKAGHHDIADILSCEWQTLDEIAERAGMARKTASSRISVHRQHVEKRHAGRFLPGQKQQYRLKRQERGRAA